jgi:hypothetical protein
MVMSYRFKFIAVLLVGLCLSGCNSGGPAVSSPSTSLLPSPLAGKWTGKSDMKDDGLTGIANVLAGNPLAGPSSVILNNDGTGFMKVAQTPEQPIAWKQEGDKVIFEGRTIQSKTGNSGDGQKTNSFGSCVGTLSNNSKSMKIDMGKVQVTVEKQKSG